VPTASEIEKEGLNLGEMDAKLLEKIEELTLYVIELKKEINELKSKN
jgi:predicted RNase H-like nuclease (RuvC/YqgF family)